MNKTSAAIKSGKENFFTSRKSLVYYENYRPFCINVGMPMDLSYAHFWGIYRLPMMLNNPVNNKFYFINDYRRIKHLMAWIVEYDFEPLKREWGEKPNAFVRLNQSFSVKQAWRTFTHDINSIMDNKVPEASITFNYEQFHDIAHDKNISQADKPGRLNAAVQDLQAKLKFGPQDFQGQGNPYFHMMEEVPGDTIEIFEDYTEQLSGYAATAFRFPMQFLPFYHFDPRTHFEQKTGIVKSIINDHRFLELKEGCSINIPDVSLMTCFDEAYLNKYLFEGISIIKWRNNESIPKQAPHMKAIDEAKFNLFPDTAGGEAGTANPMVQFPPHLFWGVKMYCPLGYEPHLYQICNDRYHIPPDSYNHMKTLYAYCETNKIPITFHASPRGMSIGDGFNYIMNDKHAPTTNDPTKWEFYRRNLSDPKVEYDKNQCADYMDLTTNRPEHWAKVLADFPKLKICFSHFTGQGFWTEPYSSTQALPTSTANLISANLQPEVGQVLA